jgi:replication factor A1
VENFFGSSAQHYVYVREYNNPSIIKPLMIAKLNKTMISYLRFDVFILGTNQCKIVVFDVFKNVPENNLYRLPQ